MRPGSVSPQAGVSAAALEGRPRAQELGQAEVDDLDVPRLREHHVLRLEVAVDDAAGVGLGEPLRHLDREVERARRARAGSRRGARRAGRPRTSSIAMNVAPSASSIS